MSLLGEDMLVTRHVYSTGTGPAEAGTQPKQRADPAPRQPRCLYLGTGYYPVCDG